MPKVTVYLKNAVIDEIKSLVEEDIQAGAHPEEVSFSSKTSMLLELGLRVYNLRRSEPAGSGHDEFDRVLMKGMLETKYYTQFLAKTMAEMKGGLDIVAIKDKVKRDVTEDMQPFFSEVDEEG